MGGAETSVKVNEQSCSICLVAFEHGDTIMELQCHHIFHEDCISRWLSMGHTCPMRCAPVSAAGPRAKPPTSEQLDAAAGAQTAAPVLVGSGEAVDGHGMTSAV